MASRWKILIFSVIRSSFLNRRIRWLVVVVFVFVCLWLGGLFGSSEEIPRHVLQDLEFQKTLERYGVSAFLVEPRWLLGLLTEEDFHLLKRREIYVKTLSRNDRLTTYGIFEDNSVHINENLIDNMITNSYDYSKTEALDPRQLYLNELDESRSTNITLKSHHFFVKQNHIFHLMVFYTRGTFLWVSPVTSLHSIVSHFIKLEDLMFGGNAAAFEKFLTITVKHRTSGYFVRVPSDVRQFISEIPSSKFLECNHQLARQFYSIHWNTSKPSKRLNYVTFFAIDAVKHMLKPLLIPFWICSGTLLGWFRQCNVIPYTSDIDLSGWARDIHSSLDNHVWKNNEKLTLKIIFGMPWESYQYVFTYDGFRVDFFFTYKDENSYWYGGHGPGENVYFHYNYPKFELCSGDLIGQKVLVPCNPEEVISAEYGKNWQSPVKQWNYAYSAFNIGTRFRWPEKFVNRTHRYM